MVYTILVESQRLILLVFFQYVVLAAASLLPKFKVRAAVFGNTKTAKIVLCSRERQISNATKSLSIVFITKREQKTLLRICFLNELCSCRNYSFSFSSLLSFDQLYI